nr:DUF4232 domain-containing protein [Kribbella shirazensis]
MFSGLALLGGHGTETGATGTAALPTPPPAPLPTPTPPRLPTPTPRLTPAPPSATCPPSGASITVEATLRHRAVVVKVTNCRTRPLTVDGYPKVAVVNARRRTMNVTVTRGTSYLAINPGPTKIRLARGESALAAVSWSNTVEVAEDKASGTYLTVAPRPGDQPVIRPVVRPVDTDLGTTAKLTLTACRLDLPH